MQLLLIKLQTHAESQQWIINQDTGIPGVFTIAARNSDPQLYLTAPANPALRDKVFLAERITGTGPDSQRQLWRLLPESTSAYSKIQSYVADPGCGYFLNIPRGATASPLMLFTNTTGDDNYESFYFDIV